MDVPMTIAFNRQSDITSQNAVVFIQFFTFTAITLCHTDFAAAFSI